jgi:hypothetical protein
LFTTKSHFVLSSGRTIRSCQDLFARDRVTYNCPCAKTSVRKYNPNYARDCPSALFVIGSHDITVSAGIAILLMKIA